MSKIRYRTIPKSERDKMLRALSKVITTYRHENNVMTLLGTLLTPSEIVMLTRRVQIASLLIQGKTQVEIRNALGVGYSTIKEAEKWLDGTIGDYGVIRAFVKKRQMKDKRKVRISSNPDALAFPMNKALRRAEPILGMLELLFRGMDIIVPQDDEQPKKGM